MMNYSEVPLSLGVPMPFCNWEESCGLAVFCVLRAVCGAVSLLV